MSVLYPDLISTFPENLDTFPNYQNITPADGNLIAQYMEAMNQGNQVLANQILAQIPNATQKIIKATDLNKVMQAVLATERFFKDDIYDYILEQQENWQEIINQFAYVGTYSSGNTYNKYNMVDYTVSGVKLLYIATNSVPAGTPPTSTNYWRVLTIQGTEGEAGQGLSYRQEWQPSVQYDVNQAVTYSGVLWMALQPNLGIEPGTNDEIWKKVMDFSVVTYPIQPTPPINQAIGGLWFNTENNPTNYAYLSPLTNPATASEVIVGYQAYDEGGNVLNGTAQPASGDNSKRVCRFVVGTSTNGWTENDCDYLCDGTDDQVEINQAILTLPDGGGEIVILDGSYNITASIAMNKNNVILSGNGTSTKLVRMWDSLTEEGIINITAINGNCRLEKFYIDGTGYTSANNNGINLANSNDNTIIDITFNNNNTNGYGVDLNSSNNNTISNNIFNNYNCAIHSQDNSNNSNNIITNNVCNSNDYGIYLRNNIENTIIGNICNNNSTYGIYLNNNSNNNIITGNMCNNNTYGITVLQSNDNIITNNICDNNETGISLAASNNVATGNICNNNSNIGIITNSNSNTITGNTCNNNNFGITLNAEYNNTITGNTCLNNSADGINIILSNNNTITGNTCIRGTGLPSDYTSNQDTIRCNGNNNLIIGNNILGKNYNDEGINNTWVSNKYQ